MEAPKNQCEQKVWRESASDVANRLTSLTVDEFVKLCAVPRPGFHTEKCLAYFQAWAEEHGFEHFRDDYGNFWMDVPATEGYENYPKVILQAHMDMVCVATSDNDIDFMTQGITPIINGNKMTADRTSLGADNGIGVAAALAVVTGGVGHGPIRCLFTADEDVGLHGAAALDPASLDSDYLINIDLEEENQVCYSCAGNLRASMKKTHETVAVGADETVFELKVDNLLGGHSGMDIHRNRLNGAVALTTMVKAIEGVKLVEVKAGAAFNAISQNGSMKFAVETAKVEAMKAAVAAAQAQLVEAYPLEKMEVALTQICAEGVKALTVEDSAALLALVDYLPQGVLAMSPKIEGLVQTSSNIGVFQLADGAAEVGTSSRSCVTADVDQLEDNFRAESGKYCYEMSVMSKYPGWDGDPNTPLLKLSEKAYKTIGVEAELVAIHAGLEPSWFSSKREGMQMICLGPTLTGAHTTEETLHIDTLAPTMDVVLYCLQHVNEL
ncbi:MAG: beta-Ala-His dipeptidase [Burkholderiaceae bacterium]|nr:beta-Ala-His dipeptidase [Burkholderiaceae bacterium]